MAASAEELTVLASLRDEMSSGLAKIGAQLDALAAKTAKTSKAATGFSKTLNDLSKTSNNLGSLGNGRLAGTLTKTGGALDNLSKTKAVGVLSALGAAGSTLNDKLNLHDRMTTLSSDMERAVVSAAKLTAGFGLLSMGIAGLGLKTVAGLQQSQLGLSTLTGSSSMGASLMNQVKGMTGIFSTQTLATNAVSMLNQDTPSSIVAQRLRALGNIAAVQADPTSSMSGLVSGINSIQHTGRITTEGLDSLAANGIPGYAILSQALGRTKLQVSQLVSENKISAQSFLNMIDTLSGPGLAKFRDGMQRDSQTIGGMFDTLKNKITLDLANTASPLTKSLSGAMPQITSMLSGLVNTVAPFGVHLISALVGPLGTDLPVAFAKLKPILPSIEHSISEFAVAVVQLLPSLVKLAADLLPILPEMVKLATLVVPLITDFAKLVTSSAPLRDIFAGILLSVLAFNKISGVITVVKAFSSALGVLADKLNGVAAADKVAAGAQAEEDVALGASGQGISALLSSLGMPALAAAAVYGQAKAADRPAGPTHLFGTDIKTGSSPKRSAMGDLKWDWSQFQDLNLDHPWSSIESLFGGGHSGGGHPTAASVAQARAAVAAKNALALRNTPAREASGGATTVHIDRVEINGTNLSPAELRVAVAEGMKQAYRRGSSSTTANGETYGLSRSGSRG